MATTPTGWSRDTSPIHKGEQALQARLGQSERMDEIGRKVIRPYMPDQHREFFKQLPFIVVGSVDNDGWPWASVVYGQQGFISSPHDRRLEIASAPVQGDPLNDNLKLCSPIGLLGIVPATRRRNRMNGTAERLDNGSFAVNVAQSFGNCPKYIQARDIEFNRDPAQTPTHSIETMSSLDAAAVDLVRNSDTFFVASHNDHDDPTDTGGVDVSHRGGQPGFVKVEGDMLTIPDFVGNNLFNTLGNFLVNPRGGLIFIDFDRGDHLMLTGTVELLWDMTSEIEAFKGAERAWRFHVEDGLRIGEASPLQWSFSEASPNTELTGQW